MSYHYTELWAQSGQVRINSLLWQPDAPDILGVPLVFVGGGTANAWSGEVLARAAVTGALGRRSHADLSISRRGTGLSEAPLHGYTPGDFADDVDAAVGAASLERFVLFGHSLGVPISLEYALRQPEGLAGLARRLVPARSR